MLTKKPLFALVLMFSAAAGCTLLDRQPAPNIETTPPYLQSQRNQLEELRSFHDKESVKMSKMSDDVHIIRNREMERLETAGKELEKDKLWQEDYERTLERREKWAGWFKKKNKDKDEAPLISNRTDEANKKTVR
jgi:Asp-tRNA(Asn)/Glu-tRNA(Gln) amidotransferase A subunit family amidase